MCFSVSPTSLIAGRLNTIEMCCDQPLTTIRGAWILSDENGGYISGGTFPIRTIVPGGVHRGDVIPPSWISPPDPGGNPSPEQRCIRGDVVVPIRATNFSLRGTCYDIFTREIICTEVKILPVYLDTSPGGNLPSPPPNAPIPEPFRRDDATPEVANNPLAWNNY